jgi:hypothetical protein
MSIFRRISPMQKARWSTAVATAALLALPVAAFAQSTQSTPPENPPATTSSQPPAAQADASAAKTHLSQARETLSALTSMPEAAKLQGDARAKVGELISNFNALISTPSDWRSAYGKVDANLASLLGADAPPDQPVGTSGSAALDPAIRAKLVEFRTHLKAFESAAGGAPASADATPPAAPTTTTSAPPSNPPAAPPATPTTTTSAPPSKPPSDSVSSSAATTTTANPDAQKELDAIAGILDKSKTGALTKAETAELRKHVEILRTLLSRPGL